MKGRIAMAAADSGVAVTVTDPWTIKFLFGGRPQVAYLRMQSPTDSYTRTRVRLEYISP